MGSALNNPIQSARDSAIDRTARITQVSTASDWGVPGFSTSGWSASVGYSGERSDPVAGLSLFYSRGCDTRSGSWLSKDKWPGLQAEPSSLNGYGFVAGNPVTLRDAYGFRPIGRYDYADSTPSGRRGASGLTTSRFTAPYARSSAHPDMSSYAPSKNWNGTVAKPMVVTPRVTSQTTARHDATAQAPQWQRTAADASTLTKYVAYGLGALSVGLLGLALLPDHPIANGVLALAADLTGRAALAVGSISAVLDCAAYRFDGKCVIGLLTAGMSFLISASAPGIGPPIGALIFDTHMLAFDLFVPSAPREMRPW